MREYAGDAAFRCQPSQRQHGSPLEVVTRSVGSATLRVSVGFPSRSGFMNRLVEIRSQEQMCRERAALDSERRIFWLAQAGEGGQRALDENASHFRECNLYHS